MKPGKNVKERKAYQDQWINMSHMYGNGEIYDHIRANSLEFINLLQIVKMSFVISNGKAMAI